MKILLMTQTLDKHTGGGVFASHLIESIEKLSPAITFSVMTSEGDLKPGAYNLLKNWRKIRNEMRKADIVHALDGYPYGVVAYLANIGISKPIMVTAIGSGSVQKLKGWGVRSLILKKAYRNSKELVAISAYVAREIKKEIPELDVSVINPGVDYDFYSSNSMRKHYDGPTYILTQGEFKRRKGYSQMLPIIKKILDIRPELRYVIIAHTNLNKNYQQELHELIDSLGIRDKVIFKSNLNQEELRESYRNALLYFSLPINIDGDIEGFGMSIMEAAAAGVPAVVGMGSGADDAVCDGVSGFLVRREDEKGIVDKIIHIVDNDLFRQKLAFGATELASKNTWEDKARQYIDLYEKI